MRKLSESREVWSQKSQPGELSFHLKDSFRPSGMFDRETEVLFNSWGFDKNQFIGKDIIDAGCGSMLRSKFFIGARITAIDPLADEFKKIEWSDLHKANRIFSSPLEDRIESLSGSADFIMSINVLDHCFDFKKCIENMHHYLKKDGLCFIAFDEHLGEKGTDLMHPLVIGSEDSKEICIDAGFRIKKFSTDNVFGGGTSSICFWMYK